MITQTIDEQCVNRLMLGRDLKVGPGFKRTKAKPITYLNEHGEIVTLRELATQYKAHQSVIRKAFVNNELCYKKAHKELGARL